MVVPCGILTNPDEQSLIHSPAVRSAIQQQGWMQWEDSVALQAKEPWRPQLHTDILCDFQDLNFGLDIKNNFTSTSVMEAKLV